MDENQIAATIAQQVVSDIWDGAIGGAPIGAIALNEDDAWMLYSGNREVDIKCLAKRVVGKWEHFFAINGL